LFPSPPQLQQPQTHGLHRQSQQRCPHRRSSSPHTAAPRQHSLLHNEASRTDDNSSSPYSFISFNRPPAAVQTQQNPQNPPTTSHRRLDLRVGSLKTEKKGKLKEKKELQRKNQIRGGENKTKINCCLCVVSLVVGDGGPHRQRRKIKKKKAFPIHRFAAFIDGGT
jgi:hypothetical protein